jgi:glycosyltransferase involved in cell wall biosynthesis
MKILHVFRTPVGGLFRHVCDLAAEQAARGHETGVIHDSSTGDALAAGRLEALAAVCVLGVHAMPMSRALSYRDATSLLATRRLVRELDFDVVHGHGAKGGALARLALASLSGPTSSELGRPRAFYTPHGGSLHYDPRSPAGLIFLGMERQLDRCTDGLIFESAFSARAYAAKVGASRARTKIVPNGLQAAEFAPIIHDRDSADFVFVGELRHLKGIDVLLRALAHGAIGGQATAVIAGAGPDAQALRDLASQLGLGERVRFTGALPARHAFALGRTLVVPSRAESFPYIVLEAAAAGLPLIATNVGGIPEILQGSGVGMIAPGDVDALAGAMAAALSQPERGQTGAHALKARVAERFTVARMTEGVLGFYTEARLPVAALDQPRPVAH